MDVNTLSNHVKQRPALWDASHQGHGKREEMRIQWLGVAEAMEANVELCRSKWQNLRSRWQSRANSSSRPQWHYAEAMSFLGGHRADEVPDAAENLEQERDSDVDFMMSFVPKMREMGSVQNANFRIKVSEAWLHSLQQPLMQLCRRKWQSLRRSYRSWVILDNQWIHAEAMQFLGNGNRAEADNPEDQEQHENENDDNYHFDVSLQTAMRRMTPQQNVSFRTKMMEALLHTVQQPPI